ncbi:hypothetical protein [Emticicia agri]|uniref:Uncharacterized protein n=1 Tax=Emticicia agri TaxID=2492393 RepID=A0A4Q5M5B9_9BACT|nr:hypothetical protein [Emticicia agri]RYU97706.1 hypothetical protein EWM59_00860 [Emticicia agri]
MKKILTTSLVVLIFSFKSIAQSTTITPEDGIVGQYTNQKVSIQTTENSYGFEHTAGNISLATYISNNAGWLMTKTNHPLYFSNNGNTTPNMAILTNGNVGIGISNPAEKLHVIGNARISGLAGNGLKFIRADNNGLLTSAPKTFNLNLPRSAFLSVNGNATANDIANQGLYCLGNTVADLEAPINLLDGCVISNMQIYFVDNSAKNIRAQLYRRAYGATTSDLLGVFSSSGLASTNTIQNGNTNISNNNVIDNNTYFYYLRITATITISGVEGASSWDGSKTTINQVKITYSY